MGILRKTFRTAHAIPLLGRVADCAMRRGRHLFWSWRPAYMAQTSELPGNFVSFLIAHLPATPSRFSVVEAGCGDGRVLRYLAERYPDANFVGVDLQRAAIELGARRPVQRVRLVCGSYLDESVRFEGDYLVSRTALIYLDQSEIETFLRKRLPFIRHGLLLEEIASLTGKTERSHFFAHPLSELIERLAPGEFTIEEKILDHAPWKGERWTGINLIAMRKPGNQVPEAARSVSAA